MGDRIDLYVGPGVTLRFPEVELPRYDHGQWVAEVKEDGEWSLATVEDGVLVSTESRTGIARTSDLVGMRLAPTGTGQLVGELCADLVEVSDGKGGWKTARVGTRRLHLHDVIQWGGLDFRMDFRGLPLEERRDALQMIFDGFHEIHDTGRVDLIERRDSGFLAWYREITGGTSKVLGSRAEGLVLKRRGSIAKATTADGKIDDWVRAKPKSTVDYVVLGPGGVAKKGTPKIALGLYVAGKLTEVMSPTWPKDFPGLKAGNVVEVEGWELFPSGALRSGHIKRVRDDKRAEDCTLEDAMRA